MNLYLDFSPYQRQHSDNWQALTFSIEEWIGDPVAEIVNENVSPFFAYDALLATDPEQFEVDFCWFLS